MLDRRMIVEMVAREVAEPGGGYAQPIEAVLVETMRGRLDREVRDALAGERVEGAVQFHRIRRGERAVDLATRRHDTHRADARRPMPERGPDLPREGNNGGLAAGAGHRRDHARLARV